MREKIISFIQYLVVLFLAALWIIPILWMVSTSFKPSNELFTNPPLWLPSRFSLEHLTTLFVNWPFPRWVANSFISSFAVTGISLIVSVLAAYSFARISWKGREAVFLVLLVFVLLPWEINVIPLFFLMSKLKVLNTLYGVILPLIGMPLGVFLLRQFFINIPKDMEDAARIDGCTRFGILIHVILPVSVPVIGAFCVFMFNMAWNEFFWPMICLQRTHVLTLPVGLKILHGSRGIDYGLFMAAAFMATVPSLLIFVSLRKSIIRGFTMAGSGSKG